MTNDPATSLLSIFSNSRSILSSGYYIHIIWYDNRNGASNNEIYYKQSTNNGLSWSSDLQLTNNPARSEQPALGGNGTIVHVAWQDDRDGNLLEIYYKRSTNSGVYWESDFRLTNDPGLSQNPSIAVNGLDVYIAWQERRDGNDEIYYKRSTDGGVNWGNDIRLTVNAATSSEPCIVCVGTNIQVAWYEDRDGNQEIYHKYSTNNGSTWSSDIRITNNSFQSNHPQICISGLATHLTWSDSRDGTNGEIYYKKSTNLGINWSNDTRLTFNSARSYGPAMCVSGIILHVVWYDDRNGNFEIFYKGSSNDGVSWGNDTQLTNATNQSYYPDISVSNSNLNVIWSDQRDGNWEIYFKQNPTGNIAPPNVAPNLVSPLNNSSGISLTPLINWDSVANSNSFRIQLSMDSSFSSNVGDTITTISQLAVPSNILLNNTKYYWRVCGNNNGGNGPWSSIWNFTTLQNLQGFVINPTAFEKWISGESDTIKWTGTNWSLINIILTLNIGTPLQSNYTIASGIPNGSQSYVWDIPENLLSFRSKLTIENSSNPSQNIESNIFRLKPYILTKVNSDSTYYEYRKDRDQWGFSNTEDQMFSSNWYQQFNYHGIDPFTGMNYSQTQGWFTFLLAKLRDFPDWVSWVRSFTVNGCYIDLQEPIYSPLALSKWRSRKDNWGGSCFGIAISNALIFRNKSNFINKFPSFQQFTNPSEVQANDEVRRTINELYCYQFGQPHINHTVQNGNKTVNETLRDLKKMLWSENDTLRILSFYSQDLKGGHAVLAYKLKRDNIIQSKYYLSIYDNAYPQSDSLIIIDTTENNGLGSWHYGQQPFNNWGGNNYIFLMDPVSKYLYNPIFDDQANAVLPDSILHVTNKSTSSFVIQDGNGQITGHTVDTNFLNIPESSPLISFNAIRSFPYGYALNNNHYSVCMTGFLEDTVETFFFSNNRAYTYGRNNTTFSQTDFLIFESGLTSMNFDSTTKNVNLSSIIKETNDEKQIVISELSLSINDSIKLIELDTNMQKLVNLANQKTYNIQLNYSTSIGLGEFEAYNLVIPANSSHFFIPNWYSLNNSQLIILVDLGNNGTIDDTLRIDNQIIGIENSGFVLPREYALNQNYPNPFNGNTYIVFDIVEPQEVKLTIHDILGREVSILVNNKLKEGRYKAKWNADNFASGIYFYSLKAGSFTATRKMVLVK